MERTQDLASDVADALVIVMLDDNSTYLRLVESALRPLGCRLIATSHWGELAGLVRVSAPDVVVLDVNLQIAGIDGIVIGRTIRKFYDVPILFLSGEPEEQLRAATASIPASGYLQKTAHVSRLLPDALRALVRKHAS